MKGLLEFKSLTGDVKDVDMIGRRVTGYLSAFGNKDYDGDIVEKGAFTKSIGERKDQIYFLNQHKWDQPHGKFSVLKEDTHGLYFESEPFVKGVSYSEDALKLYEAGVIKEHSIGFITVKSDIEKDARVLRELKLYEGSNVTLGSNVKTPFTGMKSSLKEINDQCTILYKAIKNGTFTDETFILLEYALKDLQTQAYELGKTALIEPSIDTQPEPHELIYKFINKIQNGREKV